ncbi:retrovirus-related pol polyprotein from transposon TNT 1-94 [Tanacetum coccineum]
MMTTDSRIEDKKPHNKNNHNNDYHQQQHRRQETIRTYPTKKYHGNLPLCTRCTLHHTGVCTVKCRNCNKVGHLTRNCRSKGPATGSNLLSVSVTCHACGEKGHYKSQCSSKTDNGTSHVSKKSLCDESLIIPKKEIWLDDKLNYMEESVEIMDREIKQLRRRCIPIVKNMTLALMVKAFKLNYSTPTNNNQRISSNLRNRQIAQPGSQNGYNAVQNLGVQNAGNQSGLIVFSGIANQNPNRNGNVVVALSGGNAIRNNGDLDEIKEVNENCILMANLQQVLTSGTQTDKAPIYDSDGSAEVQLYENYYDNEIFNMFTQEEQYIDLLEPIPEPHQVQQNDSNVISDVPSVEQNGGIVEQCAANVEETHALYDTLYNNLATEVGKVNSVNRKMKATNADLTTKLARYKNQEKFFEIN